jgi:hypothetical protein
VAYADADQLVVMNDEALLTSTPPDGATWSLRADLRDPAGAGELLDLARPVAILLCHVLPHILTDTDTDTDAHAITTRLLAGVPAGSYIAITHPDECCADGHDEHV